MGNENKFIKECIGIYLGKPIPNNLERLFNKASCLRINELAKNQRISPLLYYLYQQGTFNTIPVPDELIKQWKTTAWKNSFENQLKDLNSKILIAEIEKKNISYVYLKGKAVRQFHKEDYITTSTDLDLFIKKSCYSELKELLINSGYKIPDPDKMMSNTVLSTAEFEKSMNEIMFVKQEKAMQYIIDIQWDFISFGTKSPLHKIYDINELITNNVVRMQLDNGFNVYTLPMEKQFYIMAFHHAIHHGFRGLKWFVDMGIYYVSCKPDIQSLCKTLSKDSRKILGIVVSLINDFAGYERPDKRMRKILCTDRLLPFEFKFYKSMLMSRNKGLWNNISHRIVKVLLPYHNKTKLNVLAYILFNPDAIVHRANKEKSQNGVGNIITIFRVISENMRRKRRKSDS